MFLFAGDGNNNKFEANLSVMKLAITRSTTAFLLTACTQVASAQFAGKLVYEVARPDTKLTMIYYQDKTHARIEAYSVRMNNGVPDMSTIKAQDTLLFDLGKATETHLQQHTGYAIITQYTLSREIFASAIKNQQIDCQNMGQETVNGYQCTHFVMTQTETKYGHTSKKEIWITKDLGPAPSIYVVGNYLYYTPGYLLLTKLIQAGGDGVVVKTVQSAGGLSAIINLVSVDKKAPPASLFQVPPRYTTMDQTNYTGPGH